jgi:citrate synthase/citryl-CoA lyase
MKGEFPTSNQARVLNACLAAVIDHGIAPSEVVTRYVAASGVPLQACVAAGLTTIGDLHGGAGEAFAKMVQEAVVMAREQGRGLKEVAEEIVAKARAEKRRLPGYGHPLHPSGDPRSPKLIAIAKRYGVAGAHIELAEEIGAAMSRGSGKLIPMNIDGATGSILSDLGLSWRFARPLLLISRSAGLAAHAIEEIEREKGWRRVAADSIVYDGPPKRSIIVK